MNKRRFLWLPVLAVLAVLLLPGCVRDGIDDGQGSIPVQKGDIAFRIDFAPQTRVATDADFTSVWEDGDGIGLFAVVHGQALAATDNFIHNVKLTYSAGDGSWSGDAYWPNDGTPLDFYAYYPYEENAADPTQIAFGVQTDQNGTTVVGGAEKSNYSLSDLLTAASDNSGGGWTKGSTVALTFSHSLAMVQLTIKGTTGVIDPNEDVTVTIRNVVTGCTLNLGTPEVAATGAESNVTMYRVEQPEDGDYSTSFTFRALVPAQDMAQGASLFRIVNGDLVLSGSALTAGLSMTAGQAETFTQNVYSATTVLISAGTFQMGSPDSDDDAYAEEKPRHWVRITKDFRMGKYLVTNAQYAEFLNAVGIQEVTKQPGEISAEVSGMVDGFGEQVLLSLNQYTNVQWNGTLWEPVEGRDNYPITLVRWYGAKAYADWIGGRLPTEAEWEYACRAGTETIYSCGNSADGDYMWYYSNSNLKSHAVGEKLPNPWGLYDMHGLTDEWCMDMWDSSANYPTAATEDEAIVDPLVTTGDYRVLRGGNLENFARFCRTAVRVKNYPDQYSSKISFRLVFDN